MAFTTTNPVGAVGDPTEKGDLDVLRDNNDWLRTQMLVGHTFPGTGGRAGRHYGLAKYQGNGTATAGAAEAAILTQVDADFATGMWEAVIIIGGTKAAQWFVSGTRLGDFTEYCTPVFAVTYDLTGIGGYTTVLPATPYCKFDYVNGTTTLTLSVKPTGGSNLTWSYVVWRMSQ